MRILFITSNLIGDSILSSGILRFLINKYNKAKITIVTGPSASQLFKDFPNLDKIISVKKRKFNLHWLYLWLKLINFKWDIVIDLRSSYLSYLIYAKKRKIYKKSKKPISQVEKISQFMNSGNLLSPHIYINKNDLNDAKSLIKDKFVIAIFPGGNWKPKIWPIERYNNFLHKIQKMHQNKKLFFLIIGSKEEKDIYYEALTSNLPADSFIDIMGKSLTFTYACLSMCKIFIGNDSGLMHLSAASGITTIGLFGPTRDDWYGPFGKNCYVLRTKESYEVLKNKKNYQNQSLMTSIELDDLVEFISRKNLI